VFSIRLWRRTFLIVKTLPLGDVIKPVAAFRLLKVKA